MKKIGLFSLGFLCCVLLFGGLGNPAENTLDGILRADAASAWTPIGPFGGELRGLARNSKYPNELYASFGSYPAQVFRSTNGAKNWTRVITLQNNVSDIVTDPKNVAIVYAYTGYQILRSSDRGLTFPDSIACPSNFRGYSGRMATHPANSKIIIISGNFVTNSSSGDYCPAVARSINGGATWTVVKFEPTSRYGEIYDIGIHPKNPNIVYVCGQYCKGTVWKACVYRSTNNGGSYKNITRDAVFNPTTTYTPKAYAVALHPTDPNTAFVGHGGGVARTANGGGSWNNQSSPQSFSTSVLAVDKSKPSTIYGLGASSAEGSRGCWKSVDGGRNWTNYAGGIYGYGARLLLSGKTIIAGTWAGIFKSLNAGTLWTASHAGIRACRPDTFGVAPSSAQTIYTEIANYALFRTANGGGAWTMCPYFYRCESILGFVVHPSKPKTIIFLAGG